MARQSDLAMITSPQSPLVNDNIDQCRPHIVADMRAIVSAFPGIYDGGSRIGAARHAPFALRRHICPGRGRAFYAPHIANVLAKIATRCRHAAIDPVFRRSGQDAGLRRHSPASAIAAVDTTHIVKSAGLRNEVMFMSLTPD